MANQNGVERGLERFLFASRWLMAPMYLGLVVALLMLAVVFLRELAYYLPQMLTMQAEDVILVILTLIDLTLAANLLLIVLFSGYENFVSKFEDTEGADRPAWMGTVDFGGLKLKLVASIVAISAIDLLKWFMNIEAIEAGPAAERQFYWLVAIHLTFVISGVLLALMDWLQARTGAHK